MSDKKKLGILLGAITILIIITILVVIQYKSKNAELSNQNFSDNESEIDNIESDNLLSNSTSTVGAVQNLRGAKAQIPGASLITVNKKVITAEGQIVRNDVMPNSPNAPKAVVVDKNSLPKAALNLEIGNNVIKPNTFTVRAGQLVNLAVSSVDNQVHVLIFTDSAVGAIAMGVGAGQTKAISFNAPAVGEYVFRCDIPTHKDKGEVGKMIVK